MSSKNTSVGLAHLFQSFRGSSQDPRTFSKLLQGFSERIKLLASKYPPSWKEDFIQEGQIALHKAATNFPITSSADQFEYYATALISRKMVDFYRTTIGKSLVENELTDIDGNTFRWKEPVFTDSTGYSYTSDSTREENCNREVEGSYYSQPTISLDADYYVPKYLTEKKHPAINVQAFKLYATEGYTVSEVAQALNISVSYASKMLTKMKLESKKALSNSF